VRLGVARHVLDLRQLVELVNQLRNPLGKLVRIGILDDELILRAADAGVDGQVLHRLHVERDAGDVRGLFLEAADDVAGARAALVARLQVDQEAAGIERRVGAVDADEGGQAVDIGVLEDGGGERLLAFRHRGIGHRLRRLGDALDEAGILHREEALGHDDVEEHGEHQRADRHRQGKRLVVEHPGERPPVMVDRRVEPFLRAAEEGRLLRRMAQQLGAQHRHQRQRHHRRDQDGDGKRDGEFAEQPADDITHEEQRDQHGDERHRERDDGEADLLGALERRLEAAVALLDVARDVLDHDDGVVDNEAGGDGERHQREVVEAEAQEVHRREGADQRQRHGKARHDGRRHVPQKEEDHQHDQRDRQRQLELDVAHRGADGGGSIGEHADVDRGGQRILQRGQERLDAVDHLNDVGTRLALDVQDHRRLRVHPGTELAVLRALLDLRHVRQAHRRAILVGDHQVLVVVGALELVVGVDRVGARRPVEIALGRIDIGVGDGGAEIVDVEAERGELAGVGLDTHGRALAAADADQSDAGELRDLLCQARIGEVLDLRQRQGLGGDGEGQNGRVGRIDLGIDRRRRQVGRQQVAGGVDRRLNFLLGDVEAEVEIELQRDDRGAGRARRLHLVEAGHLAELALERRGDRRGHHVRARTRIERLYLDGRVVDLGQRRERQELEGDDTDHQDRRHQQRGRHRPQDEKP
jgi:hypothetical protein